MGQKTLLCNISHEDNKFVGSNGCGQKSRGMGKEERKRQVLKLLVESGLALPPAVILWNCKKRGATFERRTLDNYIEELVEEGYIEKVDEKRGYYSATTDGRDFYLNA